jgi:hypothetical protein
MVLVLTAGATRAQAQPTNDECETAPVIMEVPFSETIETEEASTGEGDPEQSCGLGGPSQNGKSVWYSFTAPRAGTLVANTFGSNYDTVLSAYTGGCEGLTEEACDDDSNGQQSRVEVAVEAGETVLFEVTDLNGEGGSLTFNLAFLVPPNDECEDPTVIGGLPYSETTQTGGATRSESDPVQSCGVAPGQNSNSVWYSFTAQADRLLIADTLGSNYDTVLTAYRGGCGELVEAACSDDVQPGQHSRVEVAVEAGETVVFEITSRGEESGGGTLVFNLDATIPLNDECEMPTEVGELPYTAMQRTSGATTSESDPVQSCGVAPGQNANSVWYGLTVPRAGLLVVDTQGSTYDTVLSLYTGECGELSEVACNGDTPENLQSRVKVAVEAGQRLLIEVTSFQGAVETLVLNVDVIEPVANDQCEGPTEVTSVPFTEMVETGNATTAASDPVQSCSPPPAQNANSVWYSFTAPSSGVVVAETLGSNYDTVLSAYTGSCGGLTEVACNDDTGLGVQSRVEVVVGAGETVLFEVTSFGGAADQLVFSLNFQQALANDECSGPTVVAGLPFMDAIQTATARTPESDPVQSCGVAPGQNSNSVWYSFTAAADTMVVASTQGSDYDTVLSAYTGGCEGLMEVACNDDVPGTVQSEVRVAVEAGETVLFEVTSFQVGGGSLSFSVQEETPTPTETPMPPVTPTPTSTPTEVVTATETQEPTPTPTMEPPLVCIGDCDGGGDVTVDELMVGVQIALGEEDLAECEFFDSDGDEKVTVDELVFGVFNALDGCPA